LKSKVEEVYATLAAKLDAREAYFEEIKSFAVSHRFEDMPLRYRKDLEAAQKNKPWRHDPKIIAILKKTAKRMVQNAG